MLSLLGKLEYKEPNTSRADAAGPWLWFYKYTTVACEDVELLLLLQHLLTALCPLHMEVVSWQQRSPRASVWGDAGRASLGSTVTAVEGGAGSWCGLLPWHVVFPDGQLTWAETWAASEIFQMQNLNMTGRVFCNEGLCYKEDIFFQKQYQKMLLEKAVYFN